jgi:hypothetical protein
MREVPSVSRPGLRRSVIEGQGTGLLAGAQTNCAVTISLRGVRPHARRFCAEMRIAWALVGSDRQPCLIPARN